MADSQRFWRGRNQKKMLRKRIYLPGPRVRVLKEMFEDKEGAMGPKKEEKKE